VRMSVYRGQVASPHTLTLLTLGDAAVGKTSLINRFCTDNFNENYVSTSFCRYMHETVIGSRRVRYTIWDTSGSMEANTTRSLAYREADVFLLCYNISDPSSLFSAINHWVPDLRLQAPSTPIVLVGSLRSNSSTMSSTRSDAMQSQQRLERAGHHWPHLSPRRQAVRPNTSIYYYSDTLRFKKTEREPAESDSGLSSESTPSHIQHRTSEALSVSPGNSNENNSQIHSNLVQTQVFLSNLKKREKNNIAKL